MKWLAFAIGFLMTLNGAEVAVHTNPLDVVSYTDHKNDKNFLINIGKKYNGLTDEGKVNKLLDQQNYIEVLNYIWTEPNGNKSIAWLEKNSVHPILMFELGEEYYFQNPSLETYINKSLPWLLAGARRTLIDSQCTSDRSAEAAVDFLLQDYQFRILEDLADKNSQEDFDKYLSEHHNDLQKNSNAILRTVMTPLAEGKGQTPAPNWVFAHGLGEFTGDKNTIADGECEKLRKKFAQDFLNQIQEMEKAPNA
jgi:hypothetical protein